MRIRVLVVAITIAVIVTATVVVVIRQLTAPLPTSANIPVTAAHGTTVRLVGATLKIPSGALSGDGRLVARTDGPQVVTSLGLNGKPGRTW